VQAAGAAYLRLEPLLAAPPPIASEPRWSSLRAAHVAGVDTPTALRPASPAVAGRLVFDDVTFTYPGDARPAIHQLCLEIPAGSLVAVTGPVGAGKSTLARLAAGICVPDAGRVLLDGQDVSGLAADERARRVGYAGQEPQLFSGSVADNVALTAEPISPQRPGSAVRRALSLAVLDPDLEEMPDGLATEIGGLGVSVSGGQRQRIALARALAAAGDVPGLLVLDDPFSAVDAHTEAAIASGLRAVLDGGAGRPARTTILLVSHRLTSFPQADVVLVVDGGLVVEVGSHAQLLAAGGLYARIYRARMALGSANDSSASGTAAGG
jgi:ABC-type multidrug transport system fused ATPase/permease subunit